MNRGNASYKLANTPAAPWTRWRGSTHGRYIRFIERYVRLPRGANARDPIKLLTWQKDFIEELFGAHVSAGCLVMGRGGGKSGLFAGLADAALFLGDDQGAPVVPIVAASLGQARQSIYDPAIWAIQHEPEMADRSLIFSGIGTERVLVPATGGLLFPRSSDPDTLQGLDIYPMGFVDEVGHVELETYNAVVMGRKRPGARVVAAGTPGPDIESPLYHLRQLVKDGNAPASFLYREFSGDPGVSIHDERNWHKANPSLTRGMPGIEFLRNAAKMTPEALFRTYHLAEFGVSGLEGWLGPDGRSIWAQGEDAYQLVPGEQTWVGVDVALYRDSSAVVAVQKRPDGRFHAELRSWIPTKDEPVDVTDIMAHVRDLSRQFKVLAVSYDERFFDVPAKLLFDERIPMVKVPQSVEHMTPACGQLYEMIRQGNLTHGPDPLFEQQVLNAVPRLNERGFTLSKGKSRGRIDAAIALALAVDRAQHVKVRAPVIVL